MDLIGSKGLVYHIPELAQPKDYKSYTEYYFNGKFIGKRLNNYFIANTEYWYFNKTENKFNVISEK